MTITTIPFDLNGKQGVLEVIYETNRSLTASGFDLLAGCGFDVNICLGYPTMRAHVRTYQGTGYYTASAWIQIITRREFLSVESGEPAAIVSSVDVNDTLDELGVPFFAIGYPAEIYDAPCNNLGDWGKLEWLADTFLVTMPSRINDHTIAPLAGFNWGYAEYDLDGERRVEIKPVVMSGISQWQRHLPLLQGQGGSWRFGD
jgi:hypothetical protein